MPGSAHEKHTDRVHSSRHSHGSQRSSLPQAMRLEEHPRPTLPPIAFVCLLSIEVVGQMDKATVTERLLPIVDTCIAADRSPPILVYLYPSLPSPPCS